MSVFEGTFSAERPDISLELTISEGNTRNGKRSGTLKAIVNNTEVHMVIDGHCHYENSSGPGVDFWIGCAKDDPNVYAALAGHGEMEFGIPFEFSAAGAISIAGTIISIPQSSFCRK